MPRPPLSITIITLNEAEKLPRTLQSVAFADEVVVVDSGSTDGTPEIAQRHGARVVRHPWMGFGRQKNFAASQATHDWVLNLDADEVVTPELAVEIRGWLERQPSGMLAIPRKTYFGSQWIRFGGWYPNYVKRLSHRAHARWTEVDLHEELQGEGAVTRASSPLLHYSFDSIGDQVATNLRYARLGAGELGRKGQRFSLFRLLFKPVSKFIECYFWKLGCLDGRLGLVIAVNAAHSMFLRQAFLLEETGGSGPKS